MKYKYLSDIEKIPLGKEIWACAYKEDPENGSMKLKCLPAKGILLTKGYNKKFVPLKADGTLRKSGDVYASSRKYADTYEECKELYNELIQNYINQLNSRIDEAKQEFI